MYMLVKITPCQNNNSKPAHVGKKLTISLSIAYKKGATSRKKVIYFKFAFSLKGYSFQMCNFIKVYTFL